MVVKQKAPKKRIGPASPKQALILNSEADITVAGGAAGSGKSHIALMSVLKYIDNEHFKAIIFRRTQPQLTLPGGLWGTAKDMYREFNPKVRVREKEKEIIFPSGAYAKFCHMEHEKNKLDHQGGQYPLIIFDEGTHFTEPMVDYLISRLRSVSWTEATGYNCRMLITCNPDYDSFLREWVEWYLDPETGIPDPAKSGIVRYFVRQNNKMIWANERAELEAIYGTGKDNGIMSFCFIPATCEDNPPLLKADPGYISKLKSRPKVDMERLLLGSWYARESTSGYWKSEWCEIVPLRPTRVKRRVRAWDISGTLASDKEPNPDYTVGVLMSIDEYGEYYIEDVVRGRWRFQGVFEQILSCAREDGSSTTIIIPQDPGAAGKAYASQIIRDLAEYGFYAKFKHTTQSKVTRFAPFASVCESGCVKIVSGSWNKDYIEELERFDGSRKVKDDQVDASSDAFWAISRSSILPVFDLPDMKQTNPFKFHERIR